MVMPEGALPFVEVRTHDEMALMAAAEWGWSRELADAHVFSTFAQAEEHVEDLAKEGERHVFAMVAAAAELPPERLRQRAKTEQRARFGVSPETAFSELERRHLA